MLLRLPRPHGSAWSLARLLVLAVAIVLLAAACTEEARPVAHHSLPTATADPAVNPTPTASASASDDGGAALPVVTPDATPPPEPTPTPDPTPDGLGRYIVARVGAGDVWQGYGSATRALAVYDEPGGQKRMLLEVNAIDRVATPLPLFNWHDRGSPTVLRVVEGEPGDAWIRVQAPTRPHDTSVWVDAADFEWAETTKRIEIDLAGPGELTVFDGDEILMTAPIVQGRDSRETPVHVTYLEAGLLGDVWDRGPVYGEAALMMASFSEQLGTFGGGGSPQNFLHGTNIPEVIGQRVSSGEIRLTNEAISELIGYVHPGVPVVMFDSSGARPGREAVLARELVPAETMGFLLNAEVTPVADRQHPQLWIPCNEPELVCANPEPDRVAADRSFRYAIAKDLDSEFQIPVFDEPNGEPRTLLDVNSIDGVELLNPLYPITAYDQPLVLRVVEEQPGWLRVQVATRPNESYAWVRASEFNVRVTDVFIEIALGRSGNGIADQAGELLFYNNDELILRTKIVSGRESRPTPLVSGWVTQIVAGSDLSPAYGDWIVGLGTFSEALGTFGGGGLPGMAIHGTNQPDLMGQRVSSGTVRIPAEELNTIVSTPGIIGAPAFIHNQRPYLDIPAARVWNGASTPARPARCEPCAEQLIMTAAAG